MLGLENWPHCLIILLHLPRMPLRIPLPSQSEIIESLRALIRKVNPKLIPPIRRTAKPAMTGPIIRFWESGMTPSAASRRGRQFEVYMSGVKRNGTRATHQKRKDTLFECCACRDRMFRHFPTVKLHSSAFLTCKH